MYRQFLVEWLFACRPPPRCSLLTEKSEFCMRCAITYLILIPLAAAVMLTGVDAFPERVIGSEPIAAAAAPEKPGHRFPDFGYLPHPSNYEGRVFKLSQDFP